MNERELNTKKKWHKPFLRSMTQREVDHAVVLSACSGYGGCYSKDSRSFP